MATLPPLPAISSEALDASIRSLNVVNNVVQALMQRGLTPPGRPEGFNGELPPNISHLDDGALGELLGKMSEYGGFVEAVLAEAAVNKEQAEEIFNQTRAGLMVDLMGAPRGKMNAEEKSSYVDCDPRTVQARSNFLYWKTYHTLTKVVVDRVQRNWDTVSRRITQRGQEVDRMVRGNSMNGRPTHNLTFRR